MYTFFSIKTVEKSSIFQSTLIFNFNNYQQKPLEK